MDSKLLFYEVLNDSGNNTNSNISKNIRCTLCPHNCILTQGKYGACRLRTIKNNIRIIYLLHLSNNQLMKNKFNISLYKWDSVHQRRK